MVLNLKTKILLIFIGLVLASSAINITIASFAIKSNLTDDLINRVIINTKSEIEDLTNFVLIGDKEGIFNLIYNQKFSHKDLAYLLVLDENNNLIASTLINKKPDAIISSNILVGDTDEKVTLITDEDSREIYDIALHLNYDKGTLRAGYYKDQIDQSVRSIIYRLLLGAVSSVCIALFFALYFARFFSKPLETLKNAAQKIESGDLSVRAEVTSNDELGFLASSFNSMADHLKEYTVGLESKVNERTQELNNKISEIERINRLMVDRELKMIELKKENKELKDKSSKII